MVVTMVSFAVVLVGLLICLGYQIALSKLECDQIWLAAERAALDAAWRGFAAARQIRELHLAAEHAMRAEVNRAMYGTNQGTRWQ
jgi:hypothetical protein